MGKCFEFHEGKCVLVSCIYNSFFFLSHHIDEDIQINANENTSSLSTSTLLSLAQYVMNDPVKG